VGALIDEKKVPVSKAAIRAGKAVDFSAAKWAFYGGEDYELLVTLKPKHLKKTEKILKRLKTKLIVVGEICKKKEGVKLLNRDGDIIDLQAREWHHFVRRQRA